MLTFDGLKKEFISEYNRQNQDGLKVISHGGENYVCADFLNWLIEEKIRKPITTLRKMLAMQFDFPEVETKIMEAKDAE